MSILSFLTIPLQSILKNEIFVKNLLTVLLLLTLSMSGFSKEAPDQKKQGQHGETEHTEIHESGEHGEKHADVHSVGHETSSEGYNPAPTIMHHIADANEWHLFGNVSIPLPVLVYNTTKKNWFFGMSNQFHAHHGEGTKEVNGYKMSHSRVVPTDGSKIIDFSITKNVATLLLTAGLMFFIFTAVARGYKKREGEAPKGIQSFFEPLILFVRDDIAVPNLGKKTDKFLPYLLCVFFFIWIGNMLGQIAPIASPNLTGNIAITAVLSLFTMLMINLNGTKHYWGHMLDPMGKDMPWYGKLFLYPILVPIELAGIVIKPVALMLRLFANITAGHIIVLSLVSLIFVFGNAGQSIPGSIAGTAIAVPFALFIGVIELLVAFLQAFIFTILTAVFIGMAVDDGHH